jgi:hypothetical protein
VDVGIIRILLARMVASCSQVGSLDMVSVAFHIGFFRGR